MQDWETRDLVCLLKRPQDLRSMRSSLVAGPTTDEVEFDFRDLTARKVRGSGGEQQHHTTLTTLLTHILFSII